MSLLDNKKIDLLPSTEEEKERLLARTLTLPRINLNRRQLCDLELLLVGGFFPLRGFLEKDDYESVLHTMRLANGRLWPIPIVLDMEDTMPYKTGDEVVLCDEYGTSLAILTITSVYRPDKEIEAITVYKTTDRAHFGVRTICDEVGVIYVGGAIEGIALPERHDFYVFRHTPQELQKWFKERGWEKIIGFQTRNPIHKAHLELMKQASEEHGAYVLIHPAIGMTKEDDFDYITRIRTYQMVHSAYMREYAKLSLLPLAMRMAGPREALWHALIRKNYGCTHFIVGRDHAGPGVDETGRPFYGPYEAQELVRKYENELGLIVVTPPEVVYVEEERRYVPKDQVGSHCTVRRLSGTRLREMLRNNKEVPEWFSFPEVIRELRRGIEKEKRKGFTVFFTGLPSAGKSTIASILYTKLLELQDREVSLLDGDVVRQNLSKGLGFSKKDRDINIERIGFVAYEITKHGGIALCAAVAPYLGARQRNRDRISRVGTYIEVYVATPLEVCRSRDPKGLYRKAQSGISRNVTGVDDPYEEPRNPEIVVDTTQASARECADVIIGYLQDKGLLV
jgi:sulfate adenylyltransferase